jgi:SIR2-like domain
MESEQQRDALRRQKEVIERLRHALEEKRLVVVVGAGVTLHATSDQSGTPLARLTWTGLMRNGLDYLVDEGLVEHSSPRILQAYGLLEDNTPNSSLDAASFVTRQLRQNGKFATWLDSVFGNLDREVRHPAILEALRNLFQRGAMLLTTNYDDLLEKACQSRHIGRSDQNELLRFKRGEVKGIVHLHGSHHNPNEVVLDGSDYDVVIHSDDIQNILRTFLEYKTLLFVGCGSGLDDPNFSALLKWAFDRQQNIPHWHCLLVRDGDTLNHKFLVRLRYGSSYQNLAPFLNALLPQPGQVTEEALKTGFGLTTSGTTSPVLPARLTFEVVDS